MDDTYSGKFWIVIWSLAAVTLIAVIAVIGYFATQPDTNRPHVVEMNGKPALCTYEEIDTKSGHDEWVCREDLKDD